MNSFRMNEDVPIEQKQIYSKNEFKDSASPQSCVNSALDLDAAELLKDAQNINEILLMC